MRSFDCNSDQAIPPSDWVLRFVHLIKPGGRILDLAAGHGRHSFYFLEQGFNVVAADIDVSSLRHKTALEGFSVLEVDLEVGHWPFHSLSFDAIVVTNYLFRPHFPWIIGSLKEMGVLLFESFGAGNEKFGRPKNPQFLLSSGEIYNFLSESLHVVSYEHGIENEPRRSVRQRICAVKGPGPFLLNESGK